MGIRVGSVYGPTYFLSAATVMIDPTGPPPRCPYSCIYCFRGETVVRTRAAAALVPPSMVEEELSGYPAETYGCVDAITIYGLGDPLLNPWSGLIARAARRVAEEHGLLLRAVTTGLLLDKPWARSLLEACDEAYIHVSAGLGDEWRAVNRPVEEASLREIEGYIASLPRHLRRRLVAYIVLFRGPGGLNSDPGTLGHIAVMVERLRLLRAYIDTINYPPANPRVKPAPPVAMRMMRKLLEERGMEAVVAEKREPPRCTGPRGPGPLYNHVLRLPLTVRQASLLYGADPEEISIVLSGLVEQGLVERIQWRGNIYYRGVAPASR